MILSGENWNVSQHHFVQRKVPRGLFLDWTRASAVRHRLLTVWIMARSYRSVSLHAFKWDVVIKWSQNLFFLHFMIVTWCTFPDVHSARVSLLVFCPLPTGRKRTFLVRFYRATFPLYTVFFIVFASSFLPCWTWASTRSWDWLCFAVGNKTGSVFLFLES
jgi:hypothetical protein